MDIVELSISNLRVITYDFSHWLCLIVDAWHDDEDVTSSPEYKHEVVHCTSVWQ